MSNRQLNAYLYAAEQGATIFDYVQIGQGFMFPNCDEVYTKVANKWYTIPGFDRRFVTGRKTMVYPVRKEKAA